MESYFISFIYFYINGKVGLKHGVVNRLTQRTSFYRKLKLLLKSLTKKAAQPGCYNTNKTTEVFEVLFTVSKFNKILPNFRVERLWVQTLLMRFSSKNEITCPTASEKKITINI